MVSHAYPNSPHFLDIEAAADVVKPETRISRRHPLRTWHSEYAKA